MSKLKGLGRGLDALLAGEKQQDEMRQQLLASNKLQPGKYQPRTHMDSDSLNELAASIKAQGVIQPILVRPIGSGRYEIIAGERRWRAAQLAGLSEIPVQVREIADEAALAMSLIENIQREDLNPLEEAQGIQRLTDEFNMTHQQAADAVGRSRSAASNLLRLLHLAKPVQQLLLEGKIDMGHARALLPLGRAQQAALAARIAAKGYSVREAERMVHHELNPPQKIAAKKVDRDLVRLEEELADKLGAGVSIKPGKKGAGQLTIRFTSLDQLDGILARLR